jgi:hypothetical protein
LSLRPQLSSGGLVFSHRVRSVLVDAWNIEAGLTWWSRGRTGLRVEFRDYIRLRRDRSAQYWTVRAGFAFR